MADCFLFPVIFLYIYIFSDFDIYFSVCCWFVVGFFGFIHLSVDVKQCV